MTKITINVNILIRLNQTMPTDLNISQHPAFRSNGALGLLGFKVWSKKMITKSV
jgi:hypothetical protein